MHKVILDKIEYHQKEIVNAYKLNEDVELAASIMPDARIWIDYEVNVNWIAKSINEVKEALRNFAKAGYLLSEFKESPTSPAWILHGKTTTIRLNPNWYSDNASVEGATCRLVQVGVTEHQPTPVYKLKCFDKDGNEVPVKQEVPVEAANAVEAAGQEEVPANE